MGLKNILFGYGLALLTFAACGAVQYRYYVPELPGNCYDQGKLIGPKPEDDIPMSTCKPDPTKKVKCVVMEFDELMAAKNEIKYLRQTLQDCQRGDRP